MTPILYASDEIDFLNNGLGQLVELYDVDIQEQRNGILTFTGSYPVTGQHYADIQEGRIILAKPSPLDDNHAFRIVNTKLDISGYAVQIEADSITYDLTHNIVKSVIMQGDGQDAMTAIQNSTLHPHIFTFYSDITHTSESQLRYVNPMEAIAGTQGSFLQNWGGELKRENRRVAMFNRRGRDNVATFRLGKNINGLQYTVNMANLVTVVIPTVSLTEGDSTRYLEGATVYSKRVGNYPIKYTQSVDVSDKIKVNDGDTDKVIIDRINAYASDWFTKPENTAKDLPDVTIEIDVLSLQDSADYADKFAKLETIGLTDTVTVYVPEYGVNVTAIVNELHYDPIGERVTNMVVGTAKVSFAEANQNALSDLQNKVTQVQEQATQAVVSANGKNSNYSGRNEPDHPQEGDTWYWEDGENSGIKVFKNGDWVDVVDTQTQERITNEVKNAVDTATAYADKLNSTQAEATNSLADELAEKSDELTKSQQNIADQATAYTNSAVAEANSKAISIGQSAAQNAQSALDAAKKDLTSSFASQASQTASMASEAKSKASQYADQAKSDAIAVATSADGVVRTEFKSTTDSMTATIQKNKSDAEGKISTAQTTATQALNGLATKVSQTEYNTKTGQLQTDLTATTQTANQAKTDIVSIKQKDGEQDEKMNSIVSDVNGTKQTVSNLQTVQGKQSGDISTLQQRADGFDATVTRVNNLSVGGRNLIIRTGEITGRIIGAEGTLSPWDGSAVTQAIITVSQGNQLTMSGSSGGDNYFRYAFYDATGKTVVRSAVDVRSSTTITTPAGATTFRISYPQASQVKLERGNIATDWTPAPEDLSSATAKAQLTADQAKLAINNYKTDADGRIEKAQADIVINSNAINTKVAKTDYDKKTGDLTTSVNKAQQTADTATQTIGTYKETNDKRVTAAETNIKANSDAISLTASKTELNNATGALNSNISTLKQRADSFEQTVSQIQTKVNNLGNVNQLFNTEFSPDFSGWTTEYRWKNGLISDDYSFFKKEIWKVNSSSIMDYIIGNSAIIISEPLPYNQSSGSVAASAYIGNGYNGSVVNDGVVALRIVFYDANKNYIGKSSGNTVVTSTTMKYVSDYMTPPDGTAYVAITLGYSGTTGLARISQPMLVFNSTSTGSYVPGNYNSNQAVAQVKLTANGLYETVNNPTTGIATRLLTAEGAVTTVQNATKELTSKQTVTAGGLTQEISDRKTGDTNTLQAGKDFTTSQIKNYDSGVQSQISQVSDGILAKVGATNLFPNSEFDADYGYKKKDGKTVLSLATKNNIDGAYNGTVSVTSTEATWQGYWANNIQVQGGQKYSASVKVHYNNGGLTNGAAMLDLWFIDNSGNRIYSGATATTSQVSSPYWVQLISEGFTAPINAVYLQMSLLVNNAGAGQVAVFTQPMLTATEKLQKYTPNSDVSSQLSLLKDNWKIGIADNIGLITSGIVGDNNSINLISKNVTIDSPNTQIKGTAWITNAMLGNASVSTVQIADAAITSAKIIDLDVNKLSGNITNFIKTNWDGQYQSTHIDSNGMTINAGSTSTAFDSSGAHITQGNLNADYSFGTWRDVSNANTSSLGLYLGIRGNSNSFTNIIGPNGGSAVLLAGDNMDYGSNNNIVKGYMNIFANVNIRSRLDFKGSRWNSPTYIEADENRRTLNFYTALGNTGNDGNYFWFSQNVLSNGVFSSASQLSKKNVKSAYEEDALGEIAKTQLVNFEYKNRVGQTHVSPIIDDVNSEKEYYIPETILGQNGEYVDMYSMISMAWKAIQQLNEKIGEK